MSYKIKNGKAVRGSGKSKLGLYHFTSPAFLPSILEHGIVPNTRDGHEDMLPGVDAVWLTADPNGNTVTEAHRKYYRKFGSAKLIAQCAGQRFLFGESAEFGCCRLTVELHENRHVQNYLKLMQINFAVDAPAPLGRIAQIPGVQDWWVSARIIAPDCITEVYPVGDVEQYNEIVEQIVKANADEPCEAVS